MGIAEVIAPGGNTVRTCSVERALCGILRPRSRADIQIVTESFKQYATRSNKNIPVYFYLGNLLSPKGLEIEN